MDQITQISPIAISNSKSTDNLARIIADKSCVCVTDHFGNALDAMTDGITTGGLSADSWSGQQKNMDYWGLAFNNIYGFNRVKYTSGSVGASGGWFEDNLTIQVKQNGNWINVKNLSFEITYPYDITSGPDITYTMTFDPIWGEGIRVIGTPANIDGRNDAFTSIEEFEVYYQ